MLIFLKAGRIALLLLWLGCSSGLWGQSAFLVPKKIKNAYQTQLLLSSFEELQYLESHLPDFQHVEIVKIDGSVDIAKAAFLCSKLGMIQELELHHFQGIISDEDLQYLEWVPSVSIYIPKNRTDATILNDAWGLLPQVSLRFEEIPDNYDFLKNWKQLRTLSVLGDMDSKDADALLAVIEAHMPRLKHLELSLVDVNQLPPRIKKCKQLHSIRIVDGSDWAQGIPMEAMGEWVVPLRIGSLPVKVGKGPNSAVMERNVYMPFKWVSSRPRLNPKETAYLKSLFPDVQEDEAVVWLEDTELELDFAEYETLKPYAFEPSKNQTSLLPNFTEGVHRFIGNSETDQVFMGDKEWALSIPKNALQTAGDKPYFGDYYVEVKYMDDAVKTAAAGLDMRYDSSRKLYALHPSFCLSVYVSSIDKKQNLSLKPGYLAEINFNSPVPATDRFYARNRSNTQWQHFYDYDYQFEFDGMPPKIDFYQFYKGQETAKIQSDFQVWSLDQAFETEGFNYVMPPNEFEMRLGKFKGDFVLDPPGAAKEIRRIVRGKTQVGIRVLPRNRKSATGIQEIQIFDRTHSLFPELDVFKGMRFAFKTQLSQQQVQAFFKDKNWIDIRMKLGHRMVVLELKTHRGIWEIALLKPSEFMEGSAKEKAQGDANFDKTFAKYEAIRSRKQTLWNVMRSQMQSQDKSQQKQALFGVTNNNARKKGRFIVQSFGVFTMAHPTEMEPAYAELILCELGKIPLEVKRVFAVYSGEPFTVLFPDIPKTKQIPLSFKNLQFIMAETLKGDVYYLDAPSLQNLKIQENTLTYIELKPLKGNPRNSAELLKEMGIRAPKKRKK